MLVQNLDTIFLQVTPDTNEVYLPKDRFLKDRNVSVVLPFLDDDIAKAPDGVAIIDNSLRSNIYVNLYELGKDYKTNNFNVSLLTPENFKRYSLDCVLDFDLSLFKLKAAVLANCYLPVCVIYATDVDNLNTPVTNNITLNCNSLTAGKITLQEIGGYKLNGKLIKQISAVNTDNCYLTIRTKDNKNNINEMPLFLLENYVQFSDNDVIFDSLDIDTDNSYITIVDTKTNPLSITFKY